MTSNLFIHPDDRKALQKLESIPVFPKVVDWYLKNGMEQIMWMQNTSYCIRLSETQFPEIFNRLPPICARMGIPVPEFYLDMDPIPNAWTSGRSRVYITITRGLIKRFSVEELDAVLAHECGHIVCQHTYYQSIATAFLSSLSLASSESIIGDTLSFVGNTALIPLKQAFTSWQRKSELSADRAASFVCDEETFLRVLAKLSQIPFPFIKQMNLREWAAQGQALRQFESQGIIQKAMKLISGIEIGTHPPEVIRAYEFREWLSSPQY
jgi:Zn-dependent protease with chaperone function